ncbi:hypothetical protein [Streptomyces mesophilus]|uniref:hypothetical protein n=1 Tax=Streptomyces mesophilus TaxID=1775132 RepID=UPI003318F25F
MAEQRMQTVRTRRGARRVMHRGPVTTLRPGSRLPLLQEESCAAGGCQGCAAGARQGCAEPAAAVRRDRTAPAAVCRDCTAPASACRGCEMNLCRNCNAPASACRTCEMNTRAAAPAGCCAKACC